MQKSSKEIIKFIDKLTEKKRIRPEEVAAEIERIKNEKKDCEIDSAIETNEILSDGETLEAIKEGLQDIKNGKAIRFEDFLRKHGYKKNNTQECKLRKG